MVDCSPVSTQVVLLFPFFDFLPVVGRLQPAHGVGLLPLQLDLPSYKVNGIVHRLSQRHSDIVVVVSGLAVLKESWQLKG